MSLCVSIMVLKGHDGGERSVVCQILEGRAVFSPPRHCARMAWHGMEGARGTSTKALLAMVCGGQAASERVAGAGEVWKASFGAQDCREFLCLGPGLPFQPHPCRGAVGFVVVDCGS